MAGCDSNEHALKHAFLILAAIFIVISISQATPFNFLKLGGHGPPPAPPPPPATSPIAEWLLTQASISGTTVADASGNNNTATVVNGSLTFGNLGANFNGSTQYLDSLLVPTTSALAVSVWFNATNLSTGANPRLVANSHTDNDLSGFQLMYNNGGATGFFDVGNGSSIGTASWSQQLVVGNWYHYVGVYDGANVIAYLNGVQVASVAFVGGAIAAGTGPDINVARNPTYTSDYFNGAIYDVRIYEQALTAAQVLTLYQQSDVIQSVSIDCATSCSYTSGTASGTAVGNASAVYSLATFSGTWSTSGTDAAKFTFSGNHLQTNGTTPTCASTTTYNLNIVATQSGAVNSPDPKAITVTCNPSSGITPPAQATAAGFTTLWDQFDFVNNKVCVYHGAGGSVATGCVNASPIGNWFECGTGNTALIWHATNFVGGITSPCNSSMVTDPTYGNTALDIQYLASCGPCAGYSMATAGTTITATFPAVSRYLEVVYRIDTGSADATALLAAIDSAYQSTADGSSTCDVDAEPAELSSGSSGAGGPFSDGGGRGSQSFGGPPCANPGSGWASFNHSPGPNLPPGYTQLQYFTYGHLMTTNGSNSIVACVFADVYPNPPTTRTQILDPQGWNGCMQGFVGVGGNQFAQDPWIVLNSNGYNLNVNFYVAYVRVWSCDPSAMVGKQCPGSTLSGSIGGTLGNTSTGLAYWHN